MRVLRPMLLFIVLFLICCAPSPRCPGNEPKQLTVELVSVKFEGSDRVAPTDGMPAYLEEYFREASVGKLEMKVSVTGPFTINDGGGCFPHAWADMLKDKVGKSDRVVFIWPTRFDCRFGGFTYLHNRYSWVNSRRASVVAHELGHTLGLEHASTSEDEYGDDTDAMGDGPGLFSGFHMMRLGWTKAREVTATGTYEVATIGTGSTLPHVLKIPIGYSDVALYIDARYAHGAFEKKTGVFARIGNNSGQNIVLDQDPTTKTIDPIKLELEIEGFTIKVERITPQSALITITRN